MTRPLTQDTSGAAAAQALLRNQNATVQRMMSMHYGQSTFIHGAKNESKINRV